jgi:hypothetical protein
MSGEHEITIGNNMSTIQENAGNEIYDDIDMNDETPCGGKYDPSTAGGDNLLANEPDEFEEEIDLGGTPAAKPGETKPPEGQAAAPAAQPPAKPTDIKSQLMEQLKDPEFQKALKELTGTPTQQQTQPPVPPTEIPKFEFTAEETANPQVFGKAIASKIMAHANQIVESRISEILDSIKPIKAEYNRTLFEKESNNIVTKYGETAKAFITKDTAEFKKLADKYVNTPGITLEEAYLLVNPGATKAQVDAEAQRKANDIIKQQQDKSIRVPVQKTPTIKHETQLLSASEAARKAMAAAGF